jgi:nitric oxide reductase large subunit
MKIRILAAVLSLLAYPGAVAVLMACERHESAGQSLLEQAVWIRAAAGVVSFIGFAMLVAEYQSWKLTNKV